MKKLLYLLLGTMAISCSKQPASITYPITEKDQTVDNYFGVEVPDPYRWLENDTSQATAEWVKAQNQVTNSYLEKLPFKKELLKRLTKLSNYEKIGTPFKKNGKFYFFKNNGLQNQSVLYQLETLDAEPKVILDPNELSEDGTVALSGISFSKDGKYMAYTISRSGSDWREIYVLDLKTNKTLPDHVKWAKFSGATWHKDGFYYSAYDAPQKGKEYSHVNENHKIYYHKLGTPQTEDRLIFENKKQPKRFYSVSIDEEEKHLFLYESGEGRGNALFVQDLNKGKNSFSTIATDFNYTYYPIETI